MALTTRSVNNLKGVSVNLCRVVTRAAELSAIKFDVIEGVRTKERQKQLYAQGRTTAGSIVTWTLNSNHFINPKTGFGHAVDILPKTGWNDLKGFDTVAQAMFQAAMELGVKSAQLYSRAVSRQFINPPIPICQAISGFASPTAERIAARL